MFMASRLRRRAIVLIPAVGSLLFASMAFFIVRSNPPNVADWRLLFWITSAFGVACSIGAYFVPEKTKKRKRLDALAPVEARLGYWFTERVRRGKVSVPLHLVALASAEDLYLGSSIDGNLCKLLQSVHDEERLVPAIEAGMMKGAAKRLDKIPLHRVTAIRADQRELFVTTPEGGNSYRLTPQADFEQVAAFVAANALPGSAPERVVEHREAGVVRKKTVADASVHYRRIGDGAGATAGW